MSLIRSLFNKATNILIENHPALDLFTIVMIFVTAIIAVIIFNSRRITRRQRTVYGFSSAGLSLGCMLSMVWTPPFSEIGVVVSLVSLGTFIIYSECDKHNLRNNIHYVKVSPKDYRKLKLTHDAIRKSPKIRKFMKSLYDKAGENNRNGVYQITPDDHEKLQEMVNEWIAKKENKKQEK